MRFSGLLILSLIGLAACSTGNAAGPTPFFQAPERREWLRIRSLSAPAETGLAHRLAGQSGRSEAWAFDEVDSARNPALIRQARLLDQVIYPAVGRQLGIDPRALPAVKLVFDHLRDSDRAGLMTEEQWQSEGGPTFVLDAELDDGAFVPAAVHELGHVMHRWLSGNPLPREGTWLEEGIARLFELEITDASPMTELSAYFSRTQTEPLQSSTGSYAQSLLFTSYLVSHLGEDAFLADLLHLQIRNMEDLAPALARAVERDTTLSPKWLTPDGLFTHFALALAINSPYVGKHQLFSLGNSKMLVNLKSLTIGSQTIPPGSHALATFQARYFSIPEGTCWQWSADQEGARVYSYVLRGTGAATRIQSGERILCGAADAAGAEVRVAMINLGPSVHVVTRLANRLPPS